jgi:hypothetical protein
MHQPMVALAATESRDHPEKHRPVAGEARDDWSRDRAGDEAADNLLSGRKEGAGGRLPLAPKWPPQAARATRRLATGPTGGVPPPGRRLQGGRPNVPRRVGTAAADASPL